MQNNDKIREFRKMIREFERCLELQNTQCCGDDVTLTQSHTLIEIAEQQEITITELAQSLGLDKSTTSRTVETLVKENLVNRIVSPHCRRTAIVSLTKTGNDLVKRIHDKNDVFFEKVLNSFPEDKQLQFIELFTEFTSQINSVKKIGCKYLPNFLK